MNKNGKSDKEHFYKNFYPPANWDTILESKEKSIYYGLLLKELGQMQADLIWANRKENRERNEENLFLLVKDYKPRDPLCLIGDLSWGYNEIKGLNKQKKQF